MKRVAVFSLVIGLGFLIGAIASVEAKEDILLHKACIHCGMDRGSFNFSRMLVQYDDGTARAFCSMHCAAVDLATNIDKIPKLIRVGDFNGKYLIDAEQAFWVIGGSRPGVMSKRGKWAFEKKEDAEDFMKANQGKGGSFEEAMKAAYEDMYEDTRMIRERRKMKRLQMDQKHGAHQ